MPVTVNFQCPRCQRRHRSARTAWICQLRNRDTAPQILVSGPHDWASISWCQVNSPIAARRIISVDTYPTHEEAIAAKERIDKRGCGGRCVRNHEIQSLDPWGINS